MFGALARSPSPDTSAAAATPLGRTFVLGLPDRQGMFRIFINGAVWRIAAGDYDPGERVSVVDVQDDLLIVKAA